MNKVEYIDSKRMNIVITETKTFNLDTGIFDSISCSFIFNMPQVIL